MYTARTCQSMTYEYLDSPPSTAAVRVNKKMIAYEYCSTLLSQSHRSQSKNLKADAGGVPGSLGPVTLS